ncbi:DUF4349 domain-containing protein [Spirosoma validum]|uniref:DUF4349 domain-containing protein n=1 Tax=Spirosoma validum TaxID=2771355 RepID=A0A927GE71_9BACT|nr:DUF4349 domain-containing protein [Spirosoma validum]MBD2754464.1 DUF4349 domain-containing protein [Spirosoma validum]
MNNFLALGLLLVVMACQSKPTNRETDQHAMADVALLQPSALTQDATSSPQQGKKVRNEQSVQPTPAINQKIIRNARVRIRVDDFKASGQAIEQAVHQQGGQITNSNETKTDNTIENALTIRVPANQFDALLTAVVNESIYTDIKTITVDDVTRQYVDVEARIRSKKVVEETYLNLLKQARSVEDVLKIEEQLGQIREEREVQEAELRQLKDNVALSTISLTYYQQTATALRPEEPFFSQLWSNFSDGFRLLGSVFIGLFYFLPVLIVGGGISWLVRRWYRQRRNTA